MSLKDVNVVNPRKRKRVAIVIANPAVSTTTGWPVGFWWSELTHPYYALNEKGYEVEIFSPEGGQCEADAMSDPRDPSGYSSSDLISMGFISTPGSLALVENTKKVGGDRSADVRRHRGRRGTGADVHLRRTRPILHKKFVEFYESGQNRLRVVSRRRHPALRETL